MIKKHHIIQIVEDIKNTANELLEEERTDLVNGQLLAYAETLSILKSVFAGEDLKELGLDEDFDRKYL